MSERMILEYALNASWQVPLTALAGWLFTRAARLGSLAEHRVWLAVLCLCLLLPLHGLQWRLAVPAMPSSPSRGAVAGEQSVPSAGRESRSSGIRTRPSGASRVTATRTLAAGSASSAPGSSRVVLTERQMHLAAGLYLLAVTLGLLRLGRGWLIARRLLRASEPYTMGQHEARVWDESCAHCAIEQPEVRLSCAVTSPSVFGILRPVLLLPRGFDRFAEKQRRAALLHEFAHIARHDPLANALCRVAAIPLTWHPASHFVTRRIERSREMVCDEIAARAMDSELIYARCLLGLAQTMSGAHGPRFAGEGLGLFKSNKLEERVMRLTESTRENNARKLWVRRSAGAAAFTGAFVCALSFHLMPVLAEPKPGNTGSAPGYGLQAKVLEYRLQETAPAVRLTAPADAQAAGATQSSGGADHPPAPGSVKTQAAPQAASASSAGSGSESNGLQTPGVDSQTMVDDGVSMAHGKDAHVYAGEGAHIHRWIAADGQPFELANESAEDLTPQQKRDAEAEFARRMVKMNEELARLRRQMNSPGFKAQINQVTNGELEKHLAQAQKQVDRVNSPEFKSELDRISGLQTDDQMAKMQRQIAEATASMNLEWKAQLDRTLRAASDYERAAELQKLDKLDRQMNRQMKALDSRQLAEAGRTLDGVAVLDSAAAAKRLADAEARMDAATARLDAATKSLEEARRQLEQTPAK